ncbi:helix-turn-helix domain-containing protein [Kitasatospora sp. NPDC059571]|uniref:helix-turn-helix domain-containing protein n=1 Tax=Kitasatospora sp. NPDC059571 TaxID=3346871 RepID=UPI0036BD76C5
MITSGDEVRQRRRAADITQHELASQVGVSAAHISQIENGATEPSTETAVLLEVVLSSYERKIPRRERTILELGTKLPQLRDEHVYQLHVYLQHILHDHYRSTRSRRY